jgi:hypothetical protein
MAYFESVAHVRTPGSSRMELPGRFRCNTRAMWGKTLVQRTRPEDYREQCAVPTRRSKYAYR